MEDIKIKKWENIEVSIIGTLIQGIVCVSYDSNGNRIERTLTVEEHAKEMKANQDLSI